MRLRFVFFLRVEPCSRGPGSQQAARFVSSRLAAWRARRVGQAYQLGARRYIRDETAAFSGAQDGRPGDVGQSSRCLFFSCLQCKCPLCSMCLARATRLASTRSPSLSWWVALFVEVAHPCIPCCALRCCLTSAGATLDRLTSTRRSFLQPDSRSGTLRMMLMAWVGKRARTAAGVQRQGGRPLSLP